jgi:hypothetical protein
MKIPPYITLEEIYKTLKIAHDIKIAEGITPYLFFKRLAITAMYGQMLDYKINYDDFLEQVEYHIHTREKPILTFWGYNHSPKHQLYYDIPVGAVRDNEHLEDEIYNNIIKNPSNGVGTKYLDFIKNYDTFNFKEHYENYRKYKNKYKVM